MVKEIAHEIKEKLLSLPFADVVAGLAQTLTTTDSAGDTTPQTVTKKLPVSYDVSMSGSDCMGKEILLIPDSSRRSIIYFEDFGVQAAGGVRMATAFNSSLRLVCWLNRANILQDTYQEITGRCQAAIIGKVCHKNPETVGMFQRLTINVAKILPQDAGIFSRYTYDETQRQYLRPPFEFFAIDLTCKFSVQNSCLDGINWHRSACV